MKRRSASNISANQMQSQNLRKVGEYRVFKLVSADASTSVILKLVGEVCNLDCSYCYEKRKPYGGNRILSAVNIESFLHSLPNTALAIEMHGGEPLLYPMGEFIALAQVLNRLRSRISRLTLQTNATLLDRKMLRFLIEQFPQIQIGISVDGPAELNQLRVNHSGQASIKSVVNAFTLCAEEKVDIGVICVVSKSSIGKAGHILRFLAQHSAVKLVKFVPCFDINVNQGLGPARRSEVRVLIEENGEIGLPWAITPEEFTNFIDDATNVWSSEIGPDLYMMEPLLSFLRANLGVTMSNCHFSPNKCSHVFTLYPDGEVGSCDELDRREAKYGYLPDNSAFISARTNWGLKAPKDIQFLLTMCESCEVAKTCGGGCLATRRRMFAAGNAEAYCEHRKSLIKITYQRLVERDV